MRHASQLRAVQQRISLLALCAVLSIPASHAAAQAVAPSAPDASRDASARALFAEGVSLAEKGDWAEAEDRFRRAFTLRASPVIAYNLASTLATRGKLIEASEMLRYVATDDKAGLDLKQSARSLSESLAKRIARVEIEVQNKAPGDSVLLDGHALYDAQLNVQIPIDPGSHQLRLQRGSRLLDQRELDVTDAGTQRVTLLAPPLAPAPAEVAEHGVPLEDAGVAPARDRAPGTAPITSRWWFWTGAGAIVVAAVVIGVAAASGGSKPEAAYHGDFTPGSLTVQVPR
jgi:hypothetical protein